MEITKRFKYAVKKVCEALGIYPPSGGSNNPKLTVTVVNNCTNNPIGTTTIFQIVDGFIRNLPVPYFTGTEEIETIIIPGYNEETERYAYYFEVNAYYGNANVNSSNENNCMLVDSDNTYYVLVTDLTKDASITLTFTDGENQPDLDV